MRVVESRIRVSIVLELLCPCVRAWVHECACACAGVRVFIHAHDERA